MDANQFVVLGATGFVGRRLCRLIAQQFPTAKILALGRKEMEICPGVISSSIDLIKDFDKAVAAIKAFSPNYIIQLAARTSFSPPKEEYEAYHILHTAIPIQLTLLAEELHALFVYTSTDMVFDGEHAPYTIHSKTSPLTIYGQSKAAAEEKLLGKAIVARFPLMYGLGGSFFQVMYDKLSNGETLSLFEDEYRTVCWSTDAANMLLVLIKKNVDKNKIWHLGGPRRVSRYDLGVALAEAAGFDKKLVRPTKVKDFMADQKRPADLSLNSEETYKLLDKKDLPKDLAEGVKAALAEGKV